MADEITLTIDGVEVKTSPGTNLLQAAMDAGIYIPYLCYYPGVKSFGACRMCVVEVGGGRGSPPPPARRFCGGGAPTRVARPWGSGAPRAATRLLL